MTKTDTETTRKTEPDRKKLQKQDRTERHIEAYRYTETNDRYKNTEKDRD